MHRDRSEPDDRAPADLPAAPGGAEPADPAAPPTDPDVTLSDLGVMPADLGATPAMPSWSAMESDTLTSTRRALHGIAELLLAGPQYRSSGTIRLRIAPGGYGTVAEPRLRVEGDELVGDGRRVATGGASYAGLAEAVGVVPGAPGVYRGGSGVAPDEPVLVDPAAAAYLARCFATGHAALRRLDPSQEPVLWPEHFDVAIVLDDVNYGVSPGDSYLAEPYAYVGPWRARQGEFWNAPFGAARPMRELTGLDWRAGAGADRPGDVDRPGDADQVFAFFAAGREWGGRS